MRNYQLWLVLLVTIASGCDSAKGFPASVQRGFVTRTYRDSRGNESKFVVFVPASYDPQVACPTILFLHGAGQTGRDGRAQVQGGLGEAIRSRTQAFPFITIFPQSHEGSWLADSADGRRAIAILEMVRKLYNVDEHRIYLTGYSMGGEGTWSLAAARPDLFAAIIPICPGSNPTAAPRLKDMPCWCFQGDADATDTLTSARKMMLAIKDAGGRPIYQEYPGVGHNCWDITYRNNDVFEWLLRHQTPWPCSQKFSKF